MSESPRSGLATSSSSETSVVDQLRLAQDRLAFYESFDAVIQANVRQSGELLRSVAAERERVEQQLAAMRREIDDQIASQQIVLQGLAGGLEGLQRNLADMTAQVATALSQLGGALPTEEAVASTAAARQELPSSAVELAIGALAGGARPALPALAAGVAGTPEVDGSTAGVIHASGDRPTELDLLRDELAAAPAPHSAEGSGQTGETDVMPTETQVPASAAKPDAGGAGDAGRVEPGGIEALTAIDAQAESVSRPSSSIPVPTEGGDTVASEEEDDHAAPVPSAVETESDASEDGPGSADQPHQFVEAVESNGVIDAGTNIAGVSSTGEAGSEPSVPAALLPNAGDEVPPVRRFDLIVRGVPRAAVAHTIQRHVQDLPAVTAVEVREYIAGVLRFQVDATAIEPAQLAAWPESAAGVVSASDIVVELAYVASPQART